MARHFRIECRLGEVPLLLLLLLLLLRWPSLRLPRIRRCSDALDVGLRVGDDTLREVCLRSLGEECFRITMLGSQRRRQHRISGGGERERQVQRKGPRESNPRVKNKPRPPDFQKRGFPWELIDSLRSRASRLAVVAEGGTCEQDNQTA